MPLNDDVADMIISQLGGIMFLSMTGAENLKVIDKGVAMDLPDDFAANGINHVEVTLTPLDLYVVKFQKVERQAETATPTVTTVSEFKDVYFDMLEEIFEKETGLFVSL